MRILVDLQVCQSESRHADRARYSLSLCKALARHQGGDEVWALLNNQFPESVRDIRLRLDGLIPSDRVIVFSPPVLTAANGRRQIWRRLAAEIIRESVIGRIRPDVVHSGNLFEGLDDGVVSAVTGFDPTICTSVSIYDTPPFSAPGLKHASQSTTEEGLRRLQSLKDFDVVLAATGYAREKAVWELQVDPEAITNISFGYEDRFHQLAVSPRTASELLERLGIRESFIFCHTEEPESGQSIAQLVEGFAALPKQLREQHPLFISQVVSEPARRKIRSRARAAGVGEGEVLIADQLSEEDLPVLYNLCALFVFAGRSADLPLAAVEAMACGAPVIGARQTSLSEAVGRDDALFDTGDSGFITQALLRGLADSGFRSSLVEHGLRRSKTFSWGTSACLALDAFRALQERSTNRAQPPARGHADRPCLAFMSPLSLDRTGMADYSTQLLPQLARYYDVEVVSDQPAIFDLLPAGSVPVRSVAWFEENRHRYTRLLYQMGDSDSHVQMLRLLERHPGVVVLHDFFLGELMDRMDPGGEAPGTLEAELLWSHGYAALRALSDEGRDVVKLRFPCNRSVVERALGVIVESPADIDLAHKWYGDCDRYFSLVPLLLKAKDQNPAQVGEIYRDAIERFYSEHPLAWQLRMTESIASVESPTRPNDSDIKAVARSVAACKRPLGPRQLFVDVSSLVEHDPRTGIQRVTRSILREMLCSPPRGFRVEPVYGAEGRYYYARDFSLGVILAPEAVKLPDVPIDAYQGDLFLGLDLAIETVEDCRSELAQLRNRGVHLAWVIYDLLPIYLADRFAKPMRDGFLRWFETVTELGDSLVAISRSVELEINAWLEASGKQDTAKPRTGFFHLGADIHKSAPTCGLPSDAESLLGIVGGFPTFLMVGTVEPRKGHEQVVGAFENLWERGIAANLVIVGKQGWMVDSLAGRLRRHPERGHRFHWLEDVSDEYLEKIYSSCTALIAASEGEGFGLPLIEAAQHRLPIIARDIPVFREVAQDHAYYFSTVQGDSLADCIRDWLALDARGAAPSSEAIKWLTWKESKENLVAALLPDSTVGHSHG